MEGHSDTQQIDGTCVGQQSETIRLHKEIVEKCNIVASTLEWGDCLATT